MEEAETKSFVERVVHSFFEGLNMILDGALYCAGAVLTLRVLGIL